MYIVHMYSYPLTYLYVRNTYTHIFKNILIQFLFINIQTFIHSQIFVCMHLIKFDLHKNNFKLIVYLTNKITQGQKQQHSHQHERKNYK